MTKLNLIGEKYGNWTVLKEGNKKGKERMWVCQCKCGLIKEVRQSDLRMGKSKGCLSCSKKKELTGQRFGRLTVLKETGKRASNNSFIWLCQCDCGKTIEVSSTMLVDKDYGYKSCGCLNRERIIESNKKRAYDLTNQKFGKLTAIKRAPNKGKETQWECQCDCGNITIVATGNLISGNSTSCGCNTSSKGEQKIKQILLNNNYLFIEQKTFNLCKFPDTNHYARFDFYLEDKNTLIEYDGIQHFILGTGHYDNEKNYNKHKNEIILKISGVKIIIFI